MARTNIAAVTTPGAYPTLPIPANSRDLVFVATDLANGNETQLIDGKTMVLVINTDAAPQTITFTSVPDAFGRSGDITAYSLAATEHGLFGPFKTAGWAQTGGKLWINASAITIHVAVITLP